MNAVIMKQRGIRIPDYTVTEEIVNSISHAFGALFGCVAMFLMGLQDQSLAHLLCGMAYGLGIVLLYSTSSLYHGLPAADPAKGAFRVADHCMVFVLVLATCTPVFLAGIGGAIGWGLFAFVAASSLVGVVLTLWDMDRTEKVCTLLHLLNGWSVVVGFHWLIGSVGWTGTAWLLAGGIVYTAGVLFFQLGASHRFMHSVFHLFCLAGTVLQFIGIYGYVL